MKPQTISRRKRKNVEVELSKNYANNLLAQIESLYHEYVASLYKYGICEMIEKVALESNSYEGYTFIYPDKTSSIFYYENPYNFTRKYF